MKEAPLPCTRRELNLAISFYHRSYIMSICCLLSYSSYKAYMMPCEGI
jgi:hypothetical protein